MSLLSGNFVGMNIIDTVPAHTLEDGDQVLVHGIDPLEDVRVTLLDQSTLKVEGYSHNSGDTAIYFLDPDGMIDVWSL